MNTASDPWDTIKCTNMHNGSPIREEKKAERMFEKNNDQRL